jgi:hypothetical protein
MYIIRDERKSASCGISKLCLPRWFFAYLPRCGQSRHFLNWWLRSGPAHIYRCDRHLWTAHRANRHARCGQAQLFKHNEGGKHIFEKNENDSWKLLASMCFRFYGRENAFFEHASTWFLKSVDLKLRRCQRCDVRPNETVQSRKLSCRYVVWIVKVLIFERVWYDE